MSISFKSLLIQVSQKHDDTQIEILKPIINSFVWKFFIAKYHSEELKDLIIKEIPQSSSKEYVEIVKLILESATGTEKGKQFNVAIFKAEAHLIAFAQSIHSLADIFAQIIYTSLNLDAKLKKPIQLKLRTISKINESISNLSEYRKLHSELNCFLKSDQFKYINAYVNTTKHRSLIPVNYSVSFIESIKPIHGLKIAKFTYNDYSFEPKFSNELIEETLVYFEKSYNSILAELNNFLNEK
jgi:hypothetical protein